MKAGCYSEDGNVNLLKTNKRPPPSPPKKESELWMCCGYGVPHHHPFTNCTRVRFFPRQRCSVMARVTFGFTSDLIIAAFYLIHSSVFFKTAYGGQALIFLFLTMKLIYGGLFSFCLEIILHYILIVFINITVKPA